MFALLGSILTFAITIAFFIEMPVSAVPSYLLIDNLSRFILLSIGLFGSLTVLYSIKYMEAASRLREYYTYVLWTIGAACGAVLANDLILLLVFWGFLGLTLYLLIGMGGPQSSDAAKKTFIIVGGSDCLMILGVGIIWLLTNTFQMNRISINLINSANLATIAYLCLAIAAFAKAGVMPVHSWIPDCADSAPVSVTAFLPASLDKLLGIYLLARISMNLFIMNKAMGIVLLAIGSITIVAAVMMALIQHDLKKLLAYHAVSQVGYMVIGIGTGNPLGIAGGLFHMLNHAIYKSCLFMGGGAVEHKTKTTDINRLGGLARVMPITFISFLVAAFAISGIPPFNGFFSKWMIYQGLLNMGKEGDKLWIIWLVAAMFGSALTLASFMKLLHAIFLGQSNRISVLKDEVPWTMWLPMVILAGLCVIFGVFAFSTAMNMFILPAVPGVAFLGFWRPGVATLLIVVGLIMGGIVYLLGPPKSVREDNPFTCGEELPREYRVSGVDFYRSIQEMGFLKSIYKKAEANIFDIYEQGKTLVFLLTRRLRRLHSGILPVYLIWCLMGMIFLFFALWEGGW